MKKMLLIIIIFLGFSLAIFLFLNNETNIENTTDNVTVVSKGKSNNEQWIIIHDEKKIYIDNFSIWALIEENETYTISYDLSNKSQKYNLTEVVPGDYNGQF